MAVKRNEKKTLNIKVITSVDEGGSPTYGNRNVSNINTTLSDADCYALGTSIAGLLQHETDSINYTYKYELAAE